MQKKVYISKEALTHLSNYASETVHGTNFKIQVYMACAQIPRINLLKQELSQDNLSNAPEWHEANVCDTVVRSIRSSSFVMGSCYNYYIW